jgi:hypothetical protein
MRKMETFVAIVDDDESVGLAIKRLLRSIVMRAEAFMGGEGFLDLISQARSYRLTFGRPSVAASRATSIRFNNAVLHRPVDPPPDRWCRSPGQAAFVYPPWLRGHP